MQVIDIKLLRERITAMQESEPWYAYNFLNDARNPSTEWDCVEDMIDSIPVIEAEPVKYGRWIMREKDKLIPTGEIAVSEGHILNKTSLDKPFTLQSANIIQIKEHRTVKIPYCSICGEYGDDESDATPYCPNCGAKMDGGVDDEATD